MTPEERLAKLETKIEQQTKEIDAMRVDIRELVDAWKAAGALVSLVRTAGAIVLSLGVIVGAWKFGINGEVPK